VHQYVVDGVFKKVVLGDDVRGAGSLVTIVLVWTDEVYIFICMHIYTYIYLYMYI